MDLSYFQKINNAYKTTKKQEVDLYEIKQNITSGFEDTIDYNIVKINDVNQGILIINTKNMLEKTIKSRPNETFYLGNYINWNNQIWIISKIDSNNQVLTTGTIKQCNITLCWLNKKGETITRYCHGQNATKYSGGLNENKVVTTPDLQMNIILPIDSETILLQRDKRFLIEDERYSSVLRENDIDPTAFKLTQRDVKTDTFSSVGGIIDLTLSEDLFNSVTDNAELFIADYYNYSTPPSTGTAEIIYSGSPIVRIGLSKTFTAIFKDSEGNILTNVTPVWTLDLTEYQENRIEYTTTNNAITITAANDNNLIDTKFKVILDDSGGLYHGELEVKVGGIFG